METGDGHSHMRTRRDPRPHVTRQVLLPSSSDEDLYSIYSSDETDDQTESDEETRPDSLPDEEAVNNEEEEERKKGTIIKKSRMEQNPSKYRCDGKTPMTDVSMGVERWYRIEVRQGTICTVRRKSAKPGLYA